MAHQFATVPELLESGVDPAIVAVVTPAKYMHETIVAAASELTAPSTTTHRRRLAGCDVTPPCSAEHPSVTAIQCEKPFGGPLADTDEMVETCQANGVIFAGGNLQRARHDVQHAARMLQQGQLGTIQGAAVHGWQGEIVGGGCQHVAVLRLLTGAEVTSVVGWFDPPEGLRDDDGLAVDNTERDGESLQVRALFQLDSGVPCPVFVSNTPHHPTPHTRELSSQLVTDMT